MDPKLTLTAIETMVETMKSSSYFERIKTYTAIKMLTDDLEQYAKDYETWNAYMSEKFSNLNWSVASLAKIDEGNGHDDVNHTNWALTAINSLRSELCFNVQ